MKDYENLDDLFDFSKSEKNIIQNAKRKSYMRMTGVSVLVSVLIVVLLILLKLQITPFLLNKELAAKEAYYEVYGANTYLSPWDEQVKVIGSTAVATQYKLLNGRPVFKREIALDSTPYETYIQPNPNKAYTYYGQNVMNFYHPQIAYDSVADDGSSLSNMPDSKLIEMGISFDKAYTVDEVLKMLPEGATLHWYWLDTFSKRDVLNMQKSIQPHAETPAHIFTEDEVVGISTFSNTGEKYENPLKEFMESVTFGMRNHGEYKDEMAGIFESITSNGKMAQDKIRIIGVVVVGDSKAISKLSKAPFTRSSSLGAITDSY
ncbi:anti sigma factor C-terminal domain-containing protein [Cytobacillus kochii]|uniref:anti sigma factor C-terminal domain-containing protein n=1 Tax=Cytobacillus kochii TaxID=859143 RepID=UPI00203E3057|nr:anti sigma factor C-terminal domain-containing protein [Cytobacillus kochii]MCM3324777.1 anti-sigma factor C-terminal domain-containing protein [Cytobacillus kochii]MCM3347170.1 anti-sigma factor C-terminal domain-containing protein [Cytobacillus kochii]